MMLIAVARKLELQLGDIGTAFLHASLSQGMMVFVRPPVNLRRPGCIWRLKKALYGLRQSPRLFQEFLAEALGQPGWVRCVVEPQLWFHLRTGAMLTAHADDLMLATPPGAREEIMHNLESKMRIKWGECLKVGVKSEWVRFLGKEMRRTEAGYELRIPLGYMGHPRVVAPREDQRRSNTFPQHQANRRSTAL